MGTGFSVAASMLGIGGSSLGAGYGAALGAPLETDEEKRRRLLAQQQAQQRGAGSAAAMSLGFGDY
jgi:hypothetical protein